MNYLNRLLIGARGKLRAGLDEEGIKHGTKSASASGVSVVPRSVDWGAKVLESALEEVLRLLDQVDLLEPLADCLESFLVRLWVML